MLTYRHKAVLAYIESYTAEHDGLCPDYRGIAAAAGLRSISYVGAILDGLEKAGKIRRLKSRFRAIELVRPSPRPMLRFTLTDGTPCVGVPSEQWKSIVRAK